MRDRSDVEGHGASSRARVGLLDNLRFNLRYVLPNILQGVFLRKPRWVALFAWLNRGSLSAGLGPRLRGLYGRNATWVRFLNKRSLLLFDRRAIEHVMENSPSVFGPPAAKCRGMAHFQPHAATVSTGADWQKRRAFNQAVLKDPRGDAELATMIHRVVQAEGRALAKKNELRWADFSDAFQSIMLRVIFGQAGEEERKAADALRRLMSRANMLVLRPSERRLSAYQSHLYELIAAAPAGSLAHFARSHAVSADIAIADQLTHWMFAMSDTLCENVARAAGAIHAIQVTRDQVRDEVRRASLDATGARSSLPYLAACLEETMRLWPTTPFILREALGPDNVDGHSVQRGDQLVIPNALNHFDSTVVEAALEWFPERWLEPRKPPAFYHLSGGAQSCSGADIARFIGVHVLAELLAEREFQALYPRIVNERRLPAAYNAFAIHLAVVDASA